MRILVIPDLHCPYNHPDAYSFIKKVKRFFKPNRVVFLGDEVDFHSISFHDKDPELFSPSKELEEAIKHLSRFYKLFPKADILESNHGSLVYRKQKYHGLPRTVFKSYNDILEAPKGWTWHYDLIIKSGGKNIYFHHGQKRNPLSNSKNHSMCYVQGHHHSNFEIQYWANKLELYWGVTSGCLIDKKSLAFAYGKNNINKPILGCTLIDNGVPRLMPMILDGNSRWTGKLL